MSGGFTAAFAQALKRTPGEILGPFYPVRKTMDRGADLTTIAGKPGRADGQVIHGKDTREQAFNDGKVVGVMRITDLMA